MNPGLGALIAPLREEDFLKSHWPGRSLFLTGDDKQMRAVAQIPQVQCLEAILQSVRGHLMVYGEAVAAVTGGVTNRMLVPVSEARTWYEQGATLEFDYAQAYIPALHRWVECVRRELGLPEGTFGKAIIYCSPKGSGLKTHFDAYANFVTQVKGSKTWKIAPNENVVDPMVHYDLFNYPNMPDELRSYWRGTPPDMDLSCGQTVELSAGSFLFLPRGYWHKTEASQEETISVNITFNQPTWLDFAMAEVRRRLVRQEHWRALADGAGAPGASVREFASSPASCVAQRWHQDVGSLSGSDLMRHWAVNVDIYQSAVMLHRQLHKENLIE